MKKLCTGEEVSSGKAGMAFVRELSRMFRAYADGSALERMAMKAAMTMPALLLQKPHHRSKAKDYTLCLERRLRLWSDGNLDELLDEGRTFQRKFTRNQPNQENSSTQTARFFAKLMMEGKVRAALRLVTENKNGGPLRLDSYADPDNSINPETFVMF